MKYKELKCNLPKDISEEFEEFLENLQVEGFYEILFDSSLAKDTNSGIIRDDTNVNVYLSENDEERDLKIRIFLKTKAVENHYIESRIVETREFEEAYKEFYKPFRIGEKFIIIPTWERDLESTKELLLKHPNCVQVFMNPGLAFGTGHHETTKLMLSKIPDVMKKGDKILDMGTGSGILSIAAGLLGASEIIAIDVDPNAVKATEFNWNENTFSENTKIQIIEGSFESKEVHSEKYDLVFANITYAVISQNIEHISKINSDHFLFSGIITDRKQDS
ncbi:MAG: 50S ribosomal protein L11 methyltransferase, partial [Leptospiraceae bacterium]|nr:50S ribosomal protein L11 methyltransferase [Leptospiraceae bacterium]